MSDFFKKHSLPPKLNLKNTNTALKIFLNDVQGDSFNTAGFETPKYQVFTLFQTLPIFFLDISDQTVLFVEKSIFSIFPTPQSVFFQGPYIKTLYGVGETEKIDFSPNKMAWSETPRKNIEVRNNIKSRYFGVSNPAVLKESPCRSNYDCQLCN